MEESLSAVIHRAIHGKYSDGNLEGGTGVKWSQFQSLNLPVIFCLPPPPLLTSEWRRNCWKHLLNLECYRKEVLCMAESDDVFLRPRATMESPDRESDKSLLEEIVKFNVEKSERLERSWKRRALSFKLPRSWRTTSNKSIR